MKNGEPLKMTQIGPLKNNIEVQVTGIEIPQLSKLQHQFIMAANNSPDEKTVTLDNAAIVATLHRLISSLGFKKEWRAKAMSGTDYSDFTTLSTGNHEADIAAMALEMAKQKLTKADIAEALRGVMDEEQIIDYTINDTPKGAAELYRRADTANDAPAANA